MNQPTPNSTRILNPMPDATNEGLHVENGLLYRQYILLLVQQIKYCAALELATGRPFDQIDLTKLDTDGLQDMVAQNMARGLNISLDTARARVAQNYATANPTQIESPIQG